MKNLLYLLATIILLSCTPSENGSKFPSEEIIPETEEIINKEVIPEEPIVKETIVNTDKSFKDAVNAKGANKTSDIVKFTYEGHRYIWFAKSRKSNDRGFGFAGVVHDPDCECFNK